LAWFTDQLGATDPALTLRAPTISQVSYWRELCGVVNGAGKQGVSDDAWPADQAPSRSTLRALEERNLLVRRDRAWHLRRNWYTRIGALRLRAVPTPPLEVMDAPGEGLPTYRELQACEQIARWLDAQPRRRARLPFTRLLAVRPNHFADEEPLAMLRIMRRHKLVRHTNGCFWALSPSWQDKLRALWHGLEMSQREWSPALERDDQERLACIVASGIDTWYLNWLTEEGLPPSFEARLDDLQAEAREQETELDTRWKFDGAPLQMYQYGVSAKGQKGVSWAFILRNPSLTLKIRRLPLGNIIAQARLGSECLWRLTPLCALNELSDLLRQMWGKTKGQLQVSEIHLASDLVNFPLTDDGLSRFVSRSRKQANYEAARSHIEQLLHGLRKPGIEGVDEFEDMGIDWDTEFAGMEDDDLFGVDPFAEDDLPQHVNAVEAALEEPLDDRSRTVYRYGRRYSGVSWSLGAPLAVVLYDKTLQARLTNRRHMEPIWAANGLEPGERVTRCEVRVGRTILHDLRLRETVDTSPDAAQTVDGVSVSPFDDPWFCVEHLPDIWAMAVGQPHEDCPDAVNVAWIRQVTPLEGDTNRSRWPTDPVWTVLQRALFMPAPVTVRRLIRRRQTSASLKVLMSGMGGYLVSGVARAHPNGGQYDISAAIGEAVPMLIREFEKPNKDFGELVRERRRRWGLALPPAEKILPFRSVLERTDEAEDAAQAPALDAEPPDNASDQERALWRVSQAERRLREAEQAYELAMRQGKPARQLTRLRADLDQEAATCAAAIDRMGKLDKAR
jgi:hypothetical protein